MAAVVRDKDKRLRFPIWDRNQFHGDVGERLKLKQRYTQVEFDARCADPSSEVRPPINDGFKAWCLGDFCPPHYRCPPDWDVLAQLPTLDFFNGIGTSHANEILHVAWEHPAQKASVVFSGPTRRPKLKAAIEEFFKFAHSARYQKAVPSGRSGGPVFAEPAYIMAPTWLM